MRRVVVLALLALALPIAAWADTITLTNQFGGVNMSTAGIISSNSQLRSFVDTTAGLSVIAPPKQSIGFLNYSTGAFSGSSLKFSGTFSNVGSTFDVIGIGKWANTLSGMKGKVPIFTGSFSGPITWTVLPASHGVFYSFELSGNITGTLWNGRTATGMTTQYINTYNDQLIKDIGHISLGKTTFAPEPGTLGLLGTGLVGIAGLFRRKLTRS